LASLYIRHDAIAHAYASFDIGILRADIYSMNLQMTHPWTMD